jgi:hypothetical protein
MDGRDSLCKMIQRPVISNFCGGEPWVHHIYVYDSGHPWRMHVQHDFGNMLFWFLKLTPHCQVQLFFVAQLTWHGGNFSCIIQGIR